MQQQSISWSLPVKSLTVQSSVSKACLLAIEISSTTMVLASWMTFQRAVPLLILHSGMSMVFKSSGILKVLYAM